MQGCQIPVTIARKQSCSRATNIAVLGPVHTYRDIFESAVSSTQIKKYPRPHVSVFISDLPVHTYPTHIRLFFTKTTSVNRLDGSKFRCLSAGLENGGIVLCFRRKHLFPTCVNVIYAQNKQKIDISKQQSKQAQTSEVERNYKMFANPVFINPGRFISIQIFTLITDINLCVVGVGGGGGGCIVINSTK